MKRCRKKIFSGIEYSPEAWFHFLHHDFSSVNQEILRDSLYRWDIDYDRERVFLGFSEDTASVIAQAEQLFNEMREDLLARLTRMGIISPLEYINYTPESAREIIGRLPALVEVYMTRGDGVRETERIRFINIAEYTFRKHRLNDDQYEKKPIEDDPRNNRFDSELYPSYTDEMEEEDELQDVTELLPGPLQRAVTRVTDNNKSLQMQISKFFSENPTEENQFEKHGLTIKGGYAWIDFLNQDFSSAVPMNSQGEPLFDRLKKAFSNWELDPVRYSVNWRAGFETDFARNREEARMMFYRSLFFKLTEAKIIPRFEKEEWFAMNSRTAELYARKVPLLAEQSHVSDWLKLFEQPLPDDPNFMFRLQSSFQAVGISFDRGGGKDRFPETQTPERKKYHEYHTAKQRGLSPQFDQENDQQQTDDAYRRKHSEQDVAECPEKRSQRRQIESDYRRPEVHAGHEKSCRAFERRRAAARRNFGVDEAGSQPDHRCDAQIDARANGSGTACYGRDPEPLPVSHQKLPGKPAFQIHLGSYLGGGSSKGDSGNRGSPGNHGYTVQQSVPGAYRQNSAARNSCPIYFFTHDRAGAV
ncbi:MAG: hypothetical protein L6W00_20660 [Lentisphaeria bacterium]|nr:MAG: hypothetical protein L6W00_20660 [Lentisphaeria bacterium]